jgi:DnaK suppressor protein
MSFFKEQLMDKKKLEFFKALLLKHRQQVLNGGIITNTEDLKVQEEDLSDETDLASSLINQQLSCSIRERELFKLRKIDLALERVNDGTYGHCQDCEDEIGQKRLENQPWTDLCIIHAEEKEREEAQIYRQA